MSTIHKEYEVYLTLTSILNYESPSIQEVLSDLKGAGDIKVQLNILLTDV